MYLYSHRKFTVITEDGLCLWSRRQLRGSQWVNMQRVRDFEGLGSKWREHLPTIHFFSQRTRDYYGLGSQRTVKGREWIITVKQCVLDTTGQLHILTTAVTAYTTSSQTNNPAQKWEVCRKAHSWVAVGNWWLLSKREEGLFRERLLMPQKKVLHPCIYWKH